MILIHVFKNNNCNILSHYISVLTFISVKKDNAMIHVPGLGKSNIIIHDTKSNNNNSK